MRGSVACGPGERSSRQRFHTLCCSECNLDHVWILRVGHRLHCRGEGSCKAAEALDGTFVVALPECKREEGFHAMRRPGLKALSCRWVQQSAKCCTACLRVSIDLPSAGMPVFEHFCGGCRDALARHSRRALVALCRCPCLCAPCPQRGQAPPSNQSAFGDVRLMSRYVFGDELVAGGTGPLRLQRAKAGSWQL